MHEHRLPSADELQAAFEEAGRLEARHRVLADAVEDELDVLRRRAGDPAVARAYDEVERSCSRLEAAESSECRAAGFAAGVEGRVLVLGETVGGVRLPDGDAAARRRRCQHEAGDAWDALEALGEAAGVHAVRERWEELLDVEACEALTAGSLAGLLAQGRAARV